MKKCVGYLSGGPRASTRPDAETTGTRGRITGIISGFEALGWGVKTFIVGDRVPRKWVVKGSAKAVSSGFFRTLVVDLVRLCMGTVNARKAWREMGGQVDWLLEHSCTLQSLGWIFKQHGVPWILQTEAPLFHEAKAERKALVLSGLARWLEVRAYQECDLLVCVSEALKEIVVTDLGIPSEKVVVVPNGIDADFMNPEQHKTKRLLESFTVGFVGMLYAWAGLDLLLEAMYDLRQEGLDLSLVVVGDGSMRRAWEAQAQQLGISANVIFVGQVPWLEVPQYIAGFDVCYSGQVQMQVGKMYLSPLKLYEYTAMAKPVVASAFEDSQRVIRDGETGFLFEAGNKDDLKRALVKAYQSQATLPEMGRKAREETVANHSWAARVSTLIAEVERILG